MYDQLLFGYYTGVNRDRIVASKEADYLLVCLHLSGHFGCPFLALSLLRISNIEILETIEFLFCQIL